MLGSFNPWKHYDNYSEQMFEDKSSDLPQWPIKLWQVPEVSPYFHHAHLLIAADCSAFAINSNDHHILLFQQFIDSCFNDFHCDHLHAYFLHFIAIVSKAQAPQGDTTLKNNIPPPGL